MLLGSSKIKNLNLRKVMEYFPGPQLALESGNRDFLVLAICVHEVTLPLRLI